MRKMYLVIGHDRSVVAEFHTLNRALWYAKLMAMSHVVYGERA
jgi:hypothetical protein